MNTQDSTKRITRKRVAIGAAGAAAVAALGTTLIAASPAGAASVSPHTAGTCTGTATVSMIVKQSDPGKLEASFEIDHTKAGSV